MKLFRENKLARLLLHCLTLAIAIGATVFSFLGVKPIVLYYTNWSVWLATLGALLAFCGSLLSFLNKGEGLLDNSLAKIIRFCGGIMIIATFVVSAFVLPDKIWTAGFWTPGSIFKHFLLPILYVASMLLADGKDSYRLYYAFIGVVPPLAYWGTVVARILIARSSNGGSIPESQWGNYYPYGFTNLDNGKSLGFLLGLLGGIAVALILIGVLFYFLNKLPKEKK